MANTPPIRVQGLSELVRAFSTLDRNLGRGLREAVENAAEPVRQEASSLMRSEISGMARSRIPWWTMRTGSTRNGAYVAPVQRGVKGRPDDKRRRPNLVGIGLNKALVPALERNRERVEDSVLAEMDDLFRAWERI